MARGSIDKHIAKDGTVSWRIRVDIGASDSAGRRQRQRTYKTRREAETQLRRWLQELHPGEAPEPINRRRNYSPADHPTIYFVEAETLRAVKIGLSTHVPTRLRDLQIGCPDRLIVLGLQSALPWPERREVEVQQYFWKLRLAGEWFRAEEDLLTYIAQETLSPSDYYTNLLGPRARAFLAAHPILLRSRLP